MRRGFVKIDQGFSPQLSDEYVYCRVTWSSPSPLPSKIGGSLGNANPVWVAERGVMVLWRRLLALQILVDRGVPVVHFCEKRVEP